MRLIGLLSFLYSSFFIFHALAHAQPKESSAAAAEAVSDEGEVQLDDNAGVDAATEASAGKEKKPLKLPRTGILASTTISDGSSVSMPMPWGEGNSPANIQSPVRAAVFKKGEQWVLSLSNSSKDRSLYVSVELAQYSMNGQKLKGDPFTYSLRPGERVERPVSGVANTKQVLVLLNDWKEQ